MYFLEVIPELNLGDADSYPGWAIQEQDKTGETIEARGECGVSFWTQGRVSPSVYTVQDPRATALARAEDKVQTGSHRAEPEPQLQPQPRRVMRHASRTRGGRGRNRTP